MRLDLYLLEHKLAATRSKAQQLIKARQVLVNAAVVDKNAFDITDEHVEVIGEVPYVSRAALKLKYFLPLLPFTCKGMRVLDIGSSTGGFTQLLLEEGAAHIDAVDVGTAQLHVSLKNDARVTSYEQTDIRNFKSNTRYDLITSDVSFISLHHILDDIERLAAAWMVLLFKPQFEVGREAKRDKNGVVTDVKAIEKAIMQFEDACHIKGWNLIHKAPATITGKEGNIEYCYCYQKS